MQSLSLTAFQRFGLPCITSALVACTSSSAPAPPTMPTAPTTTAASPEPAHESPVPAASSADSLNGTTPPEWQPELWMNSPPLHLSDLRGKVVLVRWWTAGCPFCSASAPALRKFDRDYGSKGLVVVGMYHHKDEGPFDPSVYRDTAKRYGFTFPLAFDPEWRTLKSWMHGVDTGWTSVTFVLDKKGVVRHVHPGGQYIEGDKAHAKLITVIEQLLAEK
ncbi:MAG TPA: TlpA disulfide reductase family protein [Polyangiaceae bacterium]|nr:TlpA disulfide reductase family protein [Polyangiaceae bacterium]